MACLKTRLYRLTNSLVIPCRLLHNAKFSTAIVSKTSVDDDDVNRLSKFADDWWNENGPMKPLHAMNKLRIKFIVQGLVNTGQINNEQYKKPEPLEGITLLDVGCGGGILSEPLARLGAKVTGLDAGKPMINVAQLHAQKDPALADHLCYICDSIEEHANDCKKTYDVVVASEVIEHVANREIFVQHCISVLKPGGSIFFTTMNKTYSSWLIGIIIAEKVLCSVPDGTHDWEKFIPPEELESLLDSNGCTTKTVHGTIINPITNEWSWCKSTSLFYALHAVKKRSRQ